jgi:hypothetical protein
MPSHDLQRPAASRALLGLAVAAACLAPSSPASAQPTRLDERCIVSVLNRNVRVRPDGTWVLPNVPANFGMVRARATCIVDGQTISGESAPFLVSANGNVNLPRIVLGPTTPIPQRVTVTGPVVPLGQVGALAQLAVTARFADGTSRNVTAASTGTRYVISNPAIAS